ncbi:MAG: hypothetical protein Q7T26_04885 [Dehalococcoidia bacterium]|nr:hypothetical protein [Dehalococcoidia bacterium]
MLHRKSKLIAVVALALSAAALSAACTSATPTAAMQPAQRTVHMAAIEPKGSTTTASEPFPTTSLPQGGGYKLNAPNKDGVWEVSTYRWLPNNLTVNQGDDVTLEIIGINGKEHPSVIQGYDVKFNVLRGQVTRVNFKADKAGIFNIVCAAHQPSMTAQLVVLPRS